MTEPGDLGHGRRYPGGEGRDLALEVDEEGVRAPAANDLDGVLADAREVEGHGAPGAKGVGANLVRVKSEGLEADFGSFKAEGGGDVAAGNGGRSGFWRGVVGADG